jgi:nucleoside-diphosphate-sugar epimerase
MRVLVTGAFGTVGRQAVAALAEDGHQVRCLDLPIRANLRAARSTSRPMSAVWGDVRDPAAVRAAVSGQDVVVHLAAILPPVSGHKPDVAFQVNVEGTRHVVQAATSQPRPPRLIFASSVAVFGPSQHKPPLRTPEDPVQATDAYSAHKIEAERLVATSGLQAAILRLGVVVPVSLAAMDRRIALRAMFAMPLVLRIECVHVSDVGRCLANAVSCVPVWGRTLLIGGGPSCRIRYRDLVDASTRAAGVGVLPEQAFSREPCYGDWMDTAESQRLLNYQRTSFADHVGELRRSQRWRRRLTTTLRPLIRKAMLAQAASPV